MCIDGERAANGEISVALHYFNGKVGRVDSLLDLAPAGPRLYRNRFLLRREVDNAVEAAHVDKQRAFGRDLATHAVTSGRDGHRTGPRLDGRYDLSGGGRCDHAVDVDRVELRHVVHEKR